MAFEFFANKTAGRARPSSSRRSVSRRSLPANREMFGEKQQRYRAERHHRQDVEAVHESQQLRLCFKLRVITGERRMHRIGMRESMGFEITRRLLQRAGQTSRGA